MATLVPILISMAVSYAMSAIITALTPNNQATGPRLTDLKSSGSAYGTPVIIGYGTCRIGGNIIWASNIREVQTTTTQGGGKGGGVGTDVRTYTYFGSFAVAWGAGPCAFIRRIWFDTKLVYDMGGISGSGSTTYPGFKVRNYLGSEDQLPDSLIVNGTGQTPADGTGDLTPGYRGLAYTVFDNCPLTDFGNRIPQISAEIAWASTENHAVIAPTFMQGALDPPGGALVDFAHGVYYAMSGGAVPGLHAFVLDTNTEYLQRSSAAIMASAAMTWNTTTQRLVGQNGMIYWCGVEGDQTGRIIELDPATLLCRRKYVTDWHTGSFRNAVGVRALTSTGAQDFLVGQGYMGGWAMWSAPLINVICVSDYYFGSIYSAPPPAGDDATVICAGRSGADHGEAWIASWVSNNGSVVHISKVSCFGRVVTPWKALDLLPSELDPAWTGMAIGSIFYDATDDTVIISTEWLNSGAAYTFKWSYTQAVATGHGIVWKAPIGPGTGSGAARLQNGTYAFPNTVSTDTIVMMDTTSGAYMIVDWTASAASGFSNHPTWSYDSTRNALLTTAYGRPGSSLLLLGRGSAGTIPLANIVADICSRVGLTAADIDVSQLTQVVRGYVLNNPTPARANIDPLALAFMFDGTESDYVLKFIPREGLAGITVAANDLIVQDTKTGNIMKETRTQESELPSKITLSYLDQDNDYQAGAQSAQRITKPLASTAASNEMTQTVPLVLTATEAKQIAEKMLYALWVERCSQAVKVTQKYLGSDCLDVVRVDLQDGTEFVSRIVSFNIGADFSLDTTLIADDPTVYVSTVQADGNIRTPQTLPSGTYLVVPTRLLLADAPSLTDASIPVGPVSNLLWASSGSAAARFAGAVLQASADGQTYANDGVALLGAAWGMAVNALPDTANLWTWDTANTLTVAVAYGGAGLSSTTDLAVLNGANPALLVDAQGSVEVIQYANATLNVDGTFTLSRLLRGRRGTDTMTGAHAAGATVIFPTTDTMHILSQALGDLNVTRWYRSVGNGTSPADAPVLVQKSIGRDLMPYAPVQLKAVKAGADIALSWVRRTRYGGELMDGSGDVPLGETSESYEVDVYKAGAVIRTLTAAAPAVTYTANQILNDFGSSPATLDLEAYQLSSVIGRGFGRRVTVGVV